jgi:hypothetical protein
MTDRVSQIPQRDGQRMLQTNAQNAFLILSAIFCVSIGLIALGWIVTNPSKEDCTTTTRRYADGRVESNQVCEKTTSFSFTLFN